MHILVTGGAGFIGSHLVDSLLADGVEVTVLDNFDSFYDRQVKERNIREHRNHERYQLIDGDLRDAERLNEQLAARFDVIVHLAARAGVRPSIERPLTYQDVNVRGTQNLLEIARRQKIPHFVFASSSSVYGVNPRVPWSEDDYVLQPISPYASTKVSGELLGHVYSHLYGFRFIALRFFTVYGPRQRPDLAIHKFAHLISSGRPIPLFGDGSTRRDYTYVDDIISGVRAAIGYDASMYEIFNLGESETTELSRLIELLERSLDMKAVIDRQPLQPGDVPITYADISKARKMLAYNPQTKIEEGIPKFVEWFRKSTR